MSSLTSKLHQTIIRQRATGVQQASTAAEPSVPEGVRLIDRLHDTELALVMQFLDARCCLTVVSRVSKRMRHNAAHPLVWKRREDILRIRWGQFLAIPRSFNFALRLSVTLEADANWPTRASLHPTVRVMELDAHRGDFSQPRWAMLLRQPAFQSLQSLRTNAEQVEKILPHPPGDEHEQHTATAAGKPSTQLRS